MPRGDTHKRRPDERWRPSSAKNTGKKRIGKEEKEKAKRQKTIGSGRKTVCLNRHRHKIFSARWPSRKGTAKHSKAPQHSYH